MSRNIMTIIKWVPLENEENKNLLIECKQLKIATNILLQSLGKFLSEFQFKNVWKSYHTISDNELLTETLENIAETAEKLVQGFDSAFQKLNLNSPLLTQVKFKCWRDTLWKIKLKLSYFLQQLVTEIAFLFVYYGENVLILTFKIANMYNQCLQMDTKYDISQTTNVCSNTCPYLMYPLRKISITKLLQILAQNRAELCCHKLIDCLLETYKLYDSHEDDNGSDNSSIEIYRAITKHMSPPLDVQEDSNNKDVSGGTIEEKENESFANMEELIQYEEQNVIELLDIAMNVAPSMLGSDTIKKCINTGETKISAKAKTKVLDYYQQILWGEVGNFLEHIILWWGSSPLSGRPPHSSQHLREWITQFLPTEIPTFILSALTSLADGLGVHVTLTSWDQQFRLALVASKTTYNSTETGRLFSDMLNNLVSLCNQCEITGDWILGAPLEELPLVEQIPILHRLDHSIHTTRLWALNETKKLANNWNVANFFMIIHCDVVNCLAQLNELRLVDHTAEIEKGGLGVHVQVCANMREKLVSEVKINHQKLKDSPNQCVENLAKVCRTVSLANLQMIFPESKYWRQVGYEVPNNPSPYVDKYLNELLSPVLAATDNHQISNMVLKIMCESWLDHIYTNKIKFSHYGAYQLLIDFATVNTWLDNCPIVTQEMRKRMLKNEVLRRCEGVGRLLLRSPGEYIKMNDKNKKFDENESVKSNDTDLMPAEMYVPNQEQWLELRAHRKKTVFASTLCCGNMN